jgi:hypothetical protein
VVTEGRRAACDATTTGPGQVTQPPRSWVFPGGASDGPSPRVALTRPRRADLKCVKVTRAQAVDIAAKTLSSLGQFRLKSALLVLSSTMSADQGPVWQLAYEPVAPRELEALPMLVIDAMTGADLTPRRGAPR